MENYDAATQAVVAVASCFLTQKERGARCEVATWAGKNVDTRYGVATRAAVAVQSRLWCGKGVDRPKALEETRRWPISFLWLLGAKIKDDVACFFLFYFIFFAERQLFFVLFRRARVSPVT